LELVVRSHLVRRIGAFAIQELIDERIEDRRKAGWPGAMIMTSNLRITMAVRDTKGSEDVVGGFLASVGAERGEPYIVGVLKADVSTRCDHANELMVVVREGIEIVHIAIEGLRKPRVLGDDLGCGLRLDSLVVLVFTDTPAYA
jgi:hypothetical protein